MARSDFYERRERRADRYRELAAKNDREASSRSDAFHKGMEIIPLGQPILVGHHSEKRHRAHLKRMETNLRKSVEADHKARYYEGRAATVEANRAIFSDDPEAVRKLKEKIGEAEKLQELMKKTNGVIRRKKDNPEACILTLQAEGLTEKQARQALEPDFMGRVGFAPYELQNNNANIRRMRQRLRSLQEMEESENTESEIGDVRIVQNAEENRTQVFFPDKPGEEVRGYLKRSGFRWSKYNGCWQRHMSNQALWLAEEAAKQYIGED